MQRWYLTKNPNVKVLEFLSYTRIELWTLREVYCNDTNFTIVFLLWEGVREERVKRVRGACEVVREKRWG